MLKNIFNVDNHFLIVFKSEMKQHVHNIEEKINLISIKSDILFG